jgi:uncharacterized protein YjbI with pentapeptide repeats
MSEGREGRRLALLVGNGIYRDGGISRLEKPAVDVRELARVLRQPGIGGFDEVTPLIDRDLNEVQEAIALFLRDRSREDLLLFYYSGHGLRQGDQLYLAMADTKGSLPSASALWSRWLHYEVEKSWSQRQILILDCCNSGLFERGAKGAAPPVLDFAEGLRREGVLAEGFGRFVLSAASLEQKAWEGKGSGPSVFTSFLVQGLATGEADLDRDGRISVSDLFTYVDKRVRLEQPGQVPRMSIQGQTGSVYVGFVPGSLSRQEAPRPAASPQPHRKFRGDEIKGKDLQGENLSGCELLDCDLSGTNLAWCTLTGARFYRCNSPGGPLNLEGAGLRGATFESCDLNGAILKDAHVEDGRLLHTKLRSARLAGCRFDRAHLEGVDIAMAQLHGAYFRYVTLDRLEFQPVFRIPFFRGVRLTRTAAATLRTVDVTGVAPCAFTEFCELESRKDRMFESAARLPVPVRLIRLGRLALFGATADFGLAPGRWFAIFAAMLLLFAGLHLEAGTASTFPAAFGTVLKTFALSWPKGATAIAFPQLVLAFVLVSVWLPKPG